MTNVTRPQDFSGDMKIAYVHTMTFPSTEANAADAIWTASALSQHVNTTFFVPRLTISKAALKALYNVREMPLRVQPFFLNYLPDRFLLKFGDFYGQALECYFQYHPAWARFQGKKILYVRHPRMLLFWGQLREHQQWLKRWTLVYESHDPLGLDPIEFQGTNPFDRTRGESGEHARRVLCAAQNFDTIICNTQAQADDLKSWTQDSLQPHFIPIASPLPRLPEPPRLRPFGEKIILGYMGTIDQFRGVHILLQAMRFLPQNYVLRMVGRFRQEKNVDPSWLDCYLHDPLIGARVELRRPVPIADIVHEIDQCDILLQPASAHILDAKYATPQKSFDYMMRGKPVVAADVPCHRVLFQEGKMAVFYTLDPHSLAHCIQNLVAHPDHAERIARAAWEQAANYSLPRRVDQILGLVQSL